MVLTPVGLDTSVIVAAVAAWHPRHAAASVAVERLLAVGAPVVIPAHALFGAFSVLTRLPKGLRVSPETAVEMLRAVAGPNTVVPAVPNDSWGFLDAAVAAGVRGGAIHDFEILDAVAAAGATKLLTLDPDDFRRFGHRGVEIVAP